MADPVERSRRRNVAEAFLLTAGSFLLYLGTMAPTVIWGDSGIYQLWGARGTTYQGAMGHPLWVFLAHLLNSLPGREPAYWANMLSALCAALAVLALFLILRRLELSDLAVWGGSLALALSHAFWLHAVIAEVYALYVALLLWAIWGILTWQRRRNLIPLAVAFFLWGLAFGDHWMAVTAILGFAWVLWTARPHRGKAVGIAFLAFAVGLSAPLYWGFFGEPISYTPGQLVPPMSHLLNPLTYLRSLPTALVYGGYQFSVLGLLGLPGWVWLWRHRRGPAVLLILVAGGQGLFVLQHHVPDQYVFFLPVYAIWAVALGCGIHAWMESPRKPTRPAGRILAAGLLLALMPLTFAVTSTITSRIDPMPGQMRQIPFREPYHFFLWPPKPGYDGAQQYARTVLQSLPPEAVLLADWTVYTPLAYEQAIHDTRPDVCVAHLTSLGKSQIEFLHEMSPRPLFLADIALPFYDLEAIYRAFDPEYYDLESISAEFEIEPYELVYALKTRE